MINDGYEGLCCELVGGATALGSATSFAAISGCSEFLRNQEEAEAQQAEESEEQTAEIALD